MSTACAVSSARARAEAAGYFKDEIVATPATMAAVEPDSGRIVTRDVVVEQDEGLRADTTYEGVSKIKPAMPGGTIAAGNASQFSDGAGACVVMSGAEASAAQSQAARHLPWLRRRRLRA